MKIFINVLLLSCCLFFAIGCADSSSDDSETPSIEQLDGNDFLFVVEQEIEESITEGFTIDDSFYVEVENGREYTVSFSADHANVSINPGNLSGQLETEENKILEYSIVEEYFAGGRFIVWIEDGDFYAELTEYGSGVPIIASEKGSLTEFE
jgi:hypothetical protein